jgi:hypothetical protein
MIDQQEHLLELTEKQDLLINEVNMLTYSLNSKKELLLKIQGAIEYLHQIGVTLPENNLEEEEIE